jgi:indolepyruvate ferredoxin oxidoreductase beta subunit
MERRVVIAGIGGQGVVFASKVVSQAALLRGEAVVASENHGMSQRGGSVMAHVKIGGGIGPLIRRGTADALLGLDRAETMRHLPYVRPGGCVFVSSANGLEAAVMSRLGELGVSVRSVNAEACARELGATAAVNLVALGYAAAHPDFGLSVADLEAAVRALGPARAVEMNLRAMALGASQARVGESR